MICHEARESLSALLDDALTPEERRPVEAHLEGCAECRRELERLRQTVALLRRVTPAHAPVGFVDRVVAAARPKPWYRRAAAAVFVPLSIKLPVEATALVMVALLAVYVFDRAPTLQQAARQEPAPAPVGGEAPASRLADEHKSVMGPPARSAPSVARGRDEERDREASGARGQAAPGPGARPASPPPAPTSPPPANQQEVPARAEPAAPTMAPVPPAPVPSAKVESSEDRAASAPRRDVENRRQALERAPGVTRPASPAPSAASAAKRARPAPADVVGRVAVKDRAAAERDLDQLIARVGGREMHRRSENDATIVEALVPQARYAEFAEGLGAIGPWRVEAERPDLPSQVHVILRLE